MCEFDSIAQVDIELEHLSGLPEPLVARLPRRPGQKEERWVQLLADGSAAVTSFVVRDQALADAVDGGTTTDLAAEVAELRSEVVELSAVVAELREQLDALRRDLY